jgi:hypothetical protein
MSNKERYFTIVNKLFWVLIILVGAFSLLHLNPNIFNEKDLARKIVLEDSLRKLELNLTDNNRKEDTVKKEEDYLTRFWSWNSFNGKEYNITFKVLKADYVNAVKRRASSKNREGDLYSELALGDYAGLDDLVEQYKKIIAAENLDYFESMNLIVSSVQNIPYTLVVDGACPLDDYTNNCSVLESRKGCCGFVLPFGVYSPIEFAVKSTGDCDTRSLFAYTILKQMGYDVSVMVSNSQTHSVLGVNVPIIPEGGDRTGNGYFASQYYLWELTVYGPLLGQKSVVGDDWRVALN